MTVVMQFEFLVATMSYVCNLNLFVSLNKFKLHIERENKSFILEYNLRYDI